ncbi:hypothetical protein [endosymbiont 'TC1' of Trimyema compressum]|nr:hypothetical protein [endosymbiont 'TC1' of Trimyema compressum]
MINGGFEDSYGSISNIGVTQVSVNQSNGWHGIPNEDKIMVCKDKGRR